MNSIFRYGGRDRKIFKKNKGYIGLVNDHHVIPKQYRNHKIIKSTGYDINSNFNLFIMPTKEGIKKLNLHPNTLFHDNHNKYNNYIEKKLNIIEKEASDKEELEYKLWLFVNFLKTNLVFNHNNIPW